jgi:hypothetical protein
LSIGVGFGSEAVDSGLKVFDGTEDTTLNRQRVSLAKKLSTALSQGAEAWG